MGRFSTSRYLRVQHGLQLADFPAISGSDMTQLNYKPDEDHVLKPISKKANTGKTGKSLRAKVLRRVFSEDFERANPKILDPRGETLRKWNKIFLAACFVSLFVDPLFFYLPIIRGDLCIDIAIHLKIILTVVRSVADICYVIQIFVKFHTAYIAPSSLVIGRGELVIDSAKIARRYLRKGFWLDLFVALPLPQLLIWVINPHLDSWGVTHSKNVIWFSSLFQYLPRVYLVFPLSSQIVAGGVISQRAWAGAAFNLLLFMLASHVSGACWYLLSIERQEDCWRSACSLENAYCPNAYFDCRNVENPKRVDWFKSSNVTSQCFSSSGSYQFGIYGFSVSNNVASSAFVNKYLYCLWWGLKNLSTIAQNLVPTIRVGENIFATIVATLGLLLFALLIGNLQRYLQSTTIRLDEWRIKRTDTEQWMHYRQLPAELRQSVRKHDQYKWLTTKGVDEEALIKCLPIDLQRKIKHHLCFELVQRVPLFDEMDETTLDAICERLTPTLCTKGVFLLREGDPVNEMLFIIRGHLDSYTTNGGRTGFFNLTRIGPGDFCGEELLTWALDPNAGIILPSSTRSVKAITEVEAFVLGAGDIKFVASQFRRLHSKQLRHKFRFYSHQWRTWAACTLQAAWRRHKRLKQIVAMAVLEAEVSPSSQFFWARYAQNLVARSRSMERLNASAVSIVEKPTDPDFLSE